MPRSPRLGDIREWPSESDEFAIERGGSLVDGSDEALRYAAALVDIGYGDLIPIFDQLQSYLNTGYDLVEAVGKLDLVTETVFSDLLRLGF